jgi:hypothetical protein
MGDVYRARDPKRRRDVAIKVLPEGFAADPDRLARFEREAHAVAALSHPDILAIYDFGRRERPVSHERRRAARVWVYGRPLRTTRARPGGSHDRRKLTCRVRPPPTGYQEVIDPILATDSS